MLEQVILAPLARMLEQVILAPLARMLEQVILAPLARMLEPPAERVVDAAFCEVGKETPM
jgi:hypothetical protein